MKTLLNTTQAEFTTNFHNTTENIIHDYTTAATLVKAAEALGLKVPAKMSLEKTITRFRAERAKQLENHVTNIYHFRPELEIVEPEVVEVVVEPLETVEPVLEAFRAATTPAEKKTLRAKLRRLGFYLSKQEKGEK